jgi:four helix bundle protein
LEARTGTEIESTAPRRRVESYEDLECFQRAMALIRPIHDLIKTFPESERFDLVQQIQRASKSVPTNIAEGFARQASAKDYRLFLTHALGSANEVMVQLQIAIQLEYVDKTKGQDLRNEYSIVARQLNRLIRSWR